MSDRHPCLSAGAAFAAAKNPAGWSLPYILRQDAYATDGAGASPRLRNTAAVERGLFKV
jgi:hypothetical protein